MKDMIVEYVRGPKFAFLEKDGTPRASRGIPYGCLVAVKLSDGNVYVGHSLTHENDRFESRARAFEIAKGRALAINRAHKMPTSLKKKFDKFCDRARRYFKI